MFYIGIDPGKDGALSLIDEDGNVCGIFPFSEVAYVSICYQMKGRCKCALERVSARPGQGTVSMFSFGENYGFIRGILEAFNIPYETVRPQKWKKEFGLTSDKKQSIATAHRLFPGVDLRKNERCKKDHDGMAEALLLGEWARRNMR